MKNPPQRTTYLVAGLVFLIAFLVYLPALQNDFVNFDDDLYVYQNPAIQKINRSFFEWAFFRFHAANWHPLAWISHAIDHAVWGADPFGHHMTSIVLHAINGALVFFLMMKLVEVYERSRKQDAAHAVPVGETANMTMAAAAGLLFGVHPLHVESVAWVAERKDLLCALFFLLSILSYLNYVRPDNTQDQRPLASRLLDKPYLFSFGFFVLALLSKPMAVTIPLVLLIIDWYPAGRITSMRNVKDALLEKLPFLMLSVFSTIITILAQRSAHAIVPLEDTTVTTRVLVAANALIGYLIKILAPVHLLPFYPYPQDVSLFSMHYVLPVLLVLGITIASIAAARTHKLWLAVWLYYLITVLPVLGIVRFGGQSMADRYTYIPTLGFFLLIGFGISILVESASVFVKQSVLKKALVAAVGISIVFFLSVASIKQIRIWKNSISLWSYLIEAEPQKVPLAYYNRGLVYGQSNLLDLAIADFSAAISISPAFDMAFNNRGVAYFLKGNYGEAFQNLNEAIRLNKNNSEAYINRAYVYLKTGNKAFAIPDLRRGCDLGNEVGCNVLRTLLGNS